MIVWVINLAWIMVARRLMRLLSFKKNMKEVKRQVESTQIFTAREF